MKNRKRRLLAGLFASAVIAAPVLVCASELPGEDDAKDAGVEVLEEEFTEPGGETDDGDEISVTLTAEPGNGGGQTDGDASLEEDDVRALRADDTAFAVYCETDGSLTFYADTGVPAAGETYGSKTVTAVYTGFDTDVYDVWSSVPWYSNMSKILSVSFDGSFSEVKPVSTKYWFRNFNKCENFDLTNFDTSDVTNMEGMFRQCTSLTELDAGTMDVGKVTNMTDMFYGCSNLITLNVSGWDIGRVASLYSTFEGCSSLLTLDLGEWDTKNVTEMARMFYGCSALDDIDVSGWDTEKVTGMSCMFYNCSSLTSLEAGGWNTAKVTNMYCMFYGCRSLKELDIRGWDTAKVSIFTNFAIACSSLDWIDIGDEFDLFARSSVRLVPLKNWYDNRINGNLVSDNYMIGVSGEGRYYSDTISVFAVYSADDGSLIFYSDTALPAAGSTYQGKTVTDLYTGVEDTGTEKPPWYGDRESVLCVSFDESFAQIQPKSCSGWFDGFGNCASIDLANLDISGVTDMQAMFRGCSGLTGLDISGWDTGNVSSYDEFAVGCSSLEWIRIGDGFDLFAKSEAGLVSQQDWYDDNSYGKHVSYRYMIGISGAGTYWSYSAYGFGLSTADADGHVLSGAGFALTDGEGDPCRFICEGNIYTLCPPDADGAVETIPVTADGIQIEGIGDEEYVLTETKSPAGYAMIADPITIGVSDTGIVVSGGSPHAIVTGDRELLVIHDEQVLTMPNTGDCRTAGILLIGMAVLLCAAAGTLRIGKK